MILTSWIQLIVFLGAVCSAIILSVPGNVEMGSLYFDSYNYDKAFKYYSRAQKDKGDHLLNLKRLKEYYLVKGDTRKAMELQETLVKMRPKNSGYWKDMQSLYDWNLLPKEKLRAMEREAELLSPEISRKIWPEIAEGYRWLRAFDDAGRIYEKISASGDPADLEEAISYFFSRKQWEKAEELLSKSKKSTSHDVYNRWIAEIHEARGDTDKALIYWRKVIAPGFHENSPELTPRPVLEKNLYAIQKILFHLRKKNPDEAYHVAQEIGKVLPGNLTLSYDMAFAAMDAGDNERALAVFHSLEKQETDDGKIILLCELYGNLGELKERTICLEKITTRHPRNIRYLESLGDSYEAQGEKTKALRIFEKILRLQGEPDLSLIVFSELTLVAQSDPGALEARIPEKSKVKLPEDRLDRYRTRVINLREELGEGKKSEALMKRLVERHPKNIEYLKQLGFHYLDHGKKVEGQVVFAKVLKLSPGDPDALRMKLQEEFEEGKFDKVYADLGKLPPPASEADLEFRLEVFLRTDHESEARSLCQSDRARFEKFNLLCEYHFGEKEKAVTLLEKMVRERPTHEYKTLLISWQLEQEDVEKAGILLRELRSQDRMVEENKRQEEELKLLEKDIALRSALFLEHTQAYFLIPNNNFHLSSLTLWQKLNGPGAGVHLEHFNSAHPWTRITPFASFTSSRWEGKAGPVYTLGDKSGKVSLFGELSWFHSEKFFASLHYENKRPEYFLRELSKEKSATRELLTAYLGYTEKALSQTDLSLTRNRYTFRGERGSDIQVFGEHLRKGNSKLIYGGRFFAADLSSEGANINTLHIRKALAYYLTIGLSNSPLEKRMQIWTWLGRISLGGDAERGIAAGEARNARIEANYHWDDYRSFQFYTEYTKESYLALVNELKLFGLSYTAFY